MSYMAQSRVSGGARTALTYLWLVGGAFVAALDATNDAITLSKQVFLSRSWDGLSGLMPDSKSGTLMHYGTGHF